MEKPFQLEYLGEQHLFANSFRVTHTAAGLVGLTWLISMNGKELPLGTIWMPQSVYNELKKLLNEQKNPLETKQ